MAGRPRDRAPTGFVTIREAAKVLGVSEQAVRAKMNRGALPERIDTLQSGETRRYVPREALHRDGNNPSTKDDLGELTMTSEILGRELVGEVLEEIHHHEIALTRVTEEQTSAIVKQLEAIHEELQQSAEEGRERYQLVHELGEEQRAHRSQARKRARERRIVYYAILACGMLITLLVVIDIVIFDLP